MTSSVAGSATGSAAGSAVGCGSTKATGPAAQTGPIERQPLDTAAALGHVVDP